MMGARVVCFILMVFVQPFGWYTWVFGAAAIFLPYIAVVLANVGEDAKTVPAVPPGRALSEAPPARSAHVQPTVIQVSETPAPADGEQATPPPDTGEQATPPSDTGEQATPPQGRA